MEGVGGLSQPLQVFLIRQPIAEVDSGLTCVKGRVLYIQHSCCMFSIRVVCSAFAIVPSTHPFTLSHISDL